MFEQWRKRFHHGEYQKGQEAFAQELAAKDHADLMALTQGAMKAAAETIDQANEMAKDGDPHKQQLAALIKDSVLGAAHQVAATPTPSGGREAIEASPFSGNSSQITSQPSATNSPDSTPRALPEEPEKRLPGRPRKDGQPPKRRKGV